MIVNLAINLDYIAYLMIGLGIGYIVSLGVTRSPTSTERARHDVEVKKEFFRMKAQLLKTNKRG